MAEMGITDTNINSENTLFAEAWKHRPPYEPKTPKELDAVKWRAQCQCGKVSYLVKRDRPLNVKICHCRNCQVMHGAPFQLAAIFEKDDLAFIPGSGDLSFYSASNNSQEYDLPTKVSCSFCHSPIFDEGRKMVLLMPELIRIEGTPEEQRKQREVFKPTCHIFYEQRIMDIQDGTPKWSGMDQSSTLLDDAGQQVHSN